MNANSTEIRTRQRRGGPQRAVGLLTALLAGTALLAACGGGSPAAGASSMYQKSLAFAQCMRAHHALGLPDPDSQGLFSVSQMDMNSPQVQSAFGACHYLLPPGAAPIPAAQQHQLATQGLKSAACMRSHGYPDFPDPSVQQGQASVTLPSGIDPDSPQFQSAQRLCGLAGQISAGGGS
jgi:hypothetical protein